MPDPDDISTHVKLDVLIPYHRGIDYLRLALQSLLAQSSSGWRAVVVDDSGNEDAERLVRDLNDGRITFVRNDRPNGMAGNWNYAVSQARCELFCLLHADDILEPRYVEAMLECAARHPNAAAYFCHVGVINASGARIFSFPDWIKTLIEGGAAHDETVWHGEAAATKLLRGCFIFCPTVVYRRGRVPSKPFESSYGQVLDLDLFLRLILEGEQFVGLPQKLYRYRRHSLNATALQTQDLSRFAEEFALYDAVRGVFEARGWKNAAREAVKKRILFLHLGYRLFGDLCKLKVRAGLKKLIFLVRQLCGRAQRRG